MQDNYEGQHRGSDDAYERYLRGMDRSMRQKVALTAAHLLGEGTVADMGMGSGSGTLALASLYPRVQVVGVDINPEMVSRATEKHRLPNLGFREGDIAQPVFPEGSLDGIFDSSVLHHVTSFNGYDHEAAARALKNQSLQLAVGGSLIVRDFVAPVGGEVLLDLPTTDGVGGDEPTTCSTTALFERFAREFRKLSPEPGFSFQRVEGSTALPLEPGWQRFRVEHRMAVEFLLRKDYRNDWHSEVLEEYTYFSQAKFESVFVSLGLRLLASIPVHNPWIINNRFVGKAKLRTLDGTPLPFPATNHLIVGERVANDKGVRLVARGNAKPQGFLLRQRYAMPDTGGFRDLFRRPGNAIDLVPWFRDREALYVLARKGHPRPVLLAPEATPSLDGALGVGYVTEPILALQRDMPLALTVETQLEHEVGVMPSAIKSLRQAATYYPSPGGIAEEVRAVHVEIAPMYVQRELRNVTEFSTAGSVRAIDTQQVLRAAQVGALPDARLELNVYELLLREGAEWGPWIGEEIQWHVVPERNVELSPFDACTLAPRRRFVPVPDDGGAPFLELRASEFCELDAAGDVIHHQVREYVVPASRSCSTVAVALLCRTPQGVAFALDEDDLAAVQCFTGSSGIWVTPAWRLPQTITNREGAERWVEERVAVEYGCKVLTMTELGGRYHPSAGITPEAVYPYAAVVEPMATPTGRARALRWVLLRELIARLKDLPDGHLRVAALRAAHALQTQL